MKSSLIVLRLNQLIDKYGDVDVFVADDDNGFVDNIDISDISYDGTAECFVIT